MAMVPQIDDLATYRDNQIAFRGYNHNLYLGEEEFYNTSNLTGTYYPVLSPRSPRRRVRAFTKFNGLHAKNGLCWVDGTKFYFGGAPVGDVSDSAKQFVTMGAYVLIWPDKKCYNTHTGAFTDLGAVVATTGATFALSKLDGNAYGNVVTSAAEPTAPVNGQYWIDTSGDIHALKLYSAARGTWTTMGTTYVKVTAAALGTTFKQYDGVTITGTGNAQFDNAGKDYVVMSAGDGWITVVGIIDAGFTANATIERRIPDMDYITQSDNRVWGCSSSKHEIYASKLGDPANWYCYQGLSTDSYAATIGTDGDFTGAATHMGYVMFFKADCIHKVYGQRPSNYQITGSNVRGVMQGADKTICQVNETLYYLSPTGVCAYDGGAPMCVSDALGTDGFTGGAAGASANRYVASLKSASGEWGMYCFDERSGTWLREDATQAVAFARCDGTLYFVDAAGVMWADRSTASAYDDASAAPEQGVKWSAETGDIGTDTPDNGYVGRIQMRMEVEDGGRVEVSIMYDSDGKWLTLERLGKMAKQGVSVETIPCRCDHFRLKLSGVGMCKIYSVAWVRGGATEKWGC